MLQSIGKYQIVKEIGQGMFAVVFRARDTRLDRDVALKIIHPILMSDRAFVERFRREAKTLASLNHPHIIPIYEMNELEGRMFIAMALADGLNLADYITRTGRLSVAQTIKILEPIASAVDHAHLQGIIHRDIKPSNILIDKSRGPLLSDFGFSRIISSLSSASLSLSGGIVGTPAYIAPEIWDNEEATPAADFYALGCVTYEMLTGNILFAGDTPMQVMRAHDRGAHFSMDGWNSLPAQITRVLQRMVSQDKSARYSTAVEFWASLRDAGFQNKTGENGGASQNISDDWKKKTHAAIAAGEWRSAKIMVRRWLEENPKDDSARVAKLQIERAINSNAQGAPQNIPDSKSIRNPQKITKSRWKWISVFSILTLFVALAAMIALGQIGTDPTIPDTEEESQPTIVVPPTTDPVEDSADPLIFGNNGNVVLTASDGQYWEKYEADATTPTGLYLRTDRIEAFGDFLELSADGSFRLEEDGFISTGTWKIEEDQLHLRGE